MATVSCSPMTYHSIVAAGRLGDRDRAERLTADLRAYVADMRLDTPSIDYFATSLPTMLTFREDIDQAHADLVAVMEAQLALLDKDASRARGTLDELARRDPSNAVVRVLLDDTEATALV
jgi:hypothetical protein